MSFKDKARPVTQSTSTPSFVSKARPVITSAAPAEEPKKDGLFKSLVKGVAKLPIRVASSIVSPTVDLLSGKSQEEIGQRNVEGRNLFGMNIKPLGYQASAVQRGDMTLGQGALGMAKDVAGAGLEAASYAVPVGKALPIGKGILAGKVGSTMFQGGKTGLLSGLLQGAGSEMQEQDSSVGSVTKQALTTGAIGLGLGTALGPLAIPGLAMNSKKIMKEGAENIMQRVARVNALDQQKFKQAAGESIGEYLTKRGIYGTDDEIVVNLADRFVKSKEVADKALEQLPGTHKNGVLDDILGELAAREQRISTKNVPSRDLQTVNQLVEKNNTSGLTMSEINAIKRLYERNVKLGYLKENNTEAVARATNLDDVLREWQFTKAEQLGLKNLREINKETRLARQLGDALFKKTSRSEGNNAFGLTDAVLLSGGDPAAITMLLTKKTLGSGRIQSSIAKTIGPKPSVGLPVANLSKPVAGRQVIPDVIIGKNQSRIKDMVLPGASELKRTNGILPVNPAIIKPKSKITVSQAKTANDAKIKEIFGDITSKKVDTKNDIILENMARIKDITQIEPDDAKRFVELRRQMAKGPLSKDELAEAQAIIERSQGELPDVDMTTKK